jgi:Ni,Fe-hydrogenase maturation factor
MIEAIYLQDKKPDIHLITISIEKLVSMNMELSKEVEDSVPDAIATILKLADQYKV